MGACQSGDVSEAQWGDADWTEATDRRVSNFNKKTGEDQEEIDIDHEKPDNDCFEAEDELEIADDNLAEFMAVKPWIGAIKEPQNHNEVNKDPPAIGLELEYVYGYRCQDSRQNVYYNPDGNIVYMTAALGIILDKASNTQTFFGGGEVENTSKQVANDSNHHSDDLTCLKVNSNGDKQWAVSGQNGKAAAVFVWNTQTGEKRQRFKLAKNSRQVQACAIHKDGSHIAVSDNSNDHVLTIFNVDEGVKVFEDKAGPDPLMDIAFSNQDGDYTCFSVGKKHYAQWSVANMKKSKGIFGDFPRTSFACVCTDDQGNTYAGATNALIYKWAGNNIKDTYGFHDAGFIGAIAWHDGMLYSGGKDGRVNIIDSASMEVQKALQFPCPLRAIDYNGGNIVVGLRTGSIVEINAETEEQTTYVQSHNDGEVWGLSIVGNNIYTTGDDNQIKVWDITSRTCTTSAAINTAERKVNRRTKASTMGSHPDSQCGRAISVANGWVATGANDGSVTIRREENLDEIVHELRDPQRWIEVAEFSPSGNLLAVGSHDTNIYIYDATSDFSLVGVCKAHKAALTCIDWSMDESVIRSVCNAYELLFFNIPSC